MNNLFDNSFELLTTASENIEGALTDNEIMLQVDTQSVERALYHIKIAREYVASLSESKRTSVSANSGLREALANLMEVEEKNFNKRRVNG